MPSENEWNEYARDVEAEIGKHRRRAQELEEALRALVAGLDDTTWSSWQTQQKFQIQLAAARSLIAKAEGKND